jgi:hypothetical protein
MVLSRGSARRGSDDVRGRELNNERSDWEGRGSYSALSTRIPKYSESPNVACPAGLSKEKERHLVRQVPDELSLYVTDLRFHLFVAITWEQKDQA